MHFRSFLHCRHDAVAKLNTPLAKRSWFCWCKYLFQQSPSRNFSYTEGFGSNDDSDSFSAKSLAQNGPLTRIKQWKLAHSTKKTFAGSSCNEKRPFSCLSTKISNDWWLRHLPSFHFFHEKKSKKYKNQKQEIFWGGHGSVDWSGTGYLGTFTHPTILPAPK